MASHARHTLACSPPRLKVVEMVRKGLLARENLPHVGRVAPYFSILVPPAARDGYLYIRETVALKLLNLLLELGIMARRDVVVVLCGGAGGSVGLARGALVAVDVEVDGGDGLRGDGGGACVWYVGPAWSVGRFGRGDFYHAEIVHRKLSGWEVMIDGKVSRLSAAIIWVVVVSGRLRQEFGSKS